MKQLAILGSTGSIGTQALDVIAAHPTLFGVFALGAGNNITTLYEQIIRFRPRKVSVQTDASRLKLLKLLAKLPEQPEVLVGVEGLTTLAMLPQVNTVLMGVSGFAGVAPSMAALKSGKKLLTANKETFVTAGHLVKPYLNHVLPLDSEHSAIFQCLQGNQLQQVRKLILTASGGPFRTLPSEAFASITLAQALKHPNWQMGKRITIDSATMMNKGFELIEAHHLFQLPLSQIDIVVHPESIVHSAVSYIDGSTIAQLGTPDMRTPILYGLSYPGRLAIHDRATHLDFTKTGPLSFEAADENRFPCLRIARQVAEQGGSSPTVLNAADEMAVADFLSERIAFVDIAPRIEKVLKMHQNNWQAHPDLQQIIEIDTWAREAYSLV
jgi:1-deoxy-D-xylulose-5-phosphate reductoisomerase